MLPYTSAGCSKSFIFTRQNPRRKDPGGQLFRLPQPRSIEHRTPAVNQDSPAPGPGRIPPDAAARCLALLETAGAQDPLPRIAAPRAPQDLLDACEEGLRKVLPGLEELPRQLGRLGLLELDPRTGDPAGSYCEAEAAHGWPRVVVRRRGDWEDLPRLLHEMGHALQALSWSAKGRPAGQIHPAHAEWSADALVLLSLRHWPGLFEHREKGKRAALLCRARRRTALRMQARIGVGRESSPDSPEGDAEAANFRLQWLLWGPTAKEHPLSAKAWLSGLEKPSGLFLDESVAAFERSLR